jgi:hypothetical protein
MKRALDTPPGKWRGGGGGEYIEHAHHNHAFNNVI